MARNLTALIEPMSGKVAWYPGLDHVDDTDGVAINSLADYSGNGYDLFNGDLSGLPQLELNSLNGWPSVKYSTSHDKPLTYTPLSGTFPVKTVFIVAKYNGSNFGASYRGLLTDIASNAILLGKNASGTSFFDPTPTDVTYYKSQAEFAQSGMIAPFTTFELLEISNVVGWSLDGIQIGQDRADTARRWSGWIIEPLIFSAILTSVERSRVNLYYDLKYSLWKRSGVVQYALTFPSATMLPELPYYHYREIPFNWGAVTIWHEYEDGGKSLIDTTDTPPKQWEIEYTGLTPEEAEIFDAFYDAVRLKHTFNFTAKDGTDYTGVRIESYDRSHDGNKSWVNSVKITLVKYP